MDPARVGKSRWSSDLTTGNARQWWAVASRQGWELVTDWTEMADIYVSHQAHEVNGGSQVHG